MPTLILEVGIGVRRAKHPQIHAQRQQLQLSPAAPPPTGNHMDLLGRLGASREREVQRSGASHLERVAQAVRVDAGILRPLGHREEHVHQGLREVIWRRRRPACEVAGLISGFAAVSRLQESRRPNVR